MRLSKSSKLVESIPIPQTIMRKTPYETFLHNLLSTAKIGDIIYNQCSLKPRI
jgi:hypothetical protein